MLSIDSTCIRIYLCTNRERERERKPIFETIQNGEKKFDGFSRKKGGAILRRTYRHDGRRWYELTRTRFASIPGAMIGVNSMVHHRHLYSFIRNVELLHASSSTRLNWGSPNCAQLHCHSSGSHVVSSTFVPPRRIDQEWPTSWNNQGKGRGREFLLEQIKLPVTRIF